MEEEFSKGITKELWQAFRNYLIKKNNKLERESYVPTVHLVVEEIDEYLKRLEKYEI